MYQPVEQDLSVMACVFILCECQLAQTDFRLSPKFYETELSAPKGSCRVSVWLLCQSKDEDASHWKSLQFVI